MNIKYVTSNLFLVLLLLVLQFSTSFAQQSPQLAARELFNGQDYENGKKLMGLGGGIGWAGPWTGNAEMLTITNKGIVTGAGSTGAASVQVSPALNPQLLTRKLGFSPVTKGSTVWLSFSMLKESGSGRLGLSISENTREKLFIGSSERDIFVAGEHVLNGVSSSVAHRIFVRVDFKDGEDVAYVFANPGETSTPDVEGAHVTLKGQFKFDEIVLGAHSANMTGAIGPIRFGNRFQDVLIGGNSGTQALNAVSADYKVLGWKKESDALRISTNGQILRLTPYLKKVLRIQFGNQEGLDSVKNFAVSIEPEKAAFEVTENAVALLLKTKEYMVEISKADSRMRLFSPTGEVLLTEKNPIVREVSKENGRRAPASVFQLSEKESLYGLGQYRDGVLDLRGKRRELAHINTQVALPLLFSTRGWGIFWDNPTRTLFQDSKEGMEFSSDFGESLSYYVFVGSSMDELIGDYRQLTGQVPLLPKWALGYHQSRNKYATKDELLQVTERMRKEQIPFSSIFIDYYYWGKYGTGSHRFDEAQFPDMPGMVKKLHDTYNTRVVATVWPSFRPGSSNYDEMSKNGFLLEGVKALDGFVYDPFNPKAAELYKNQVKKQLLPTGIDGWFLDGPEPDNVTSFLKSTTYLGPALEVRNLYPLFHSRNYFTGLNEVDSSKRQYIITRSAWASQQKYGTVVWSGDIESSFEELKKQIPAGLNFTASGFPYWTTDIGGYSGGNPADPAYQEVYVRWWQYGAFCPIFRSHGRRFPGDTKGFNELWAFGSKVQQICTSYDQLRYRLLPYVYSLSGKVTFKDYTPMRLLAFDFPNDLLVRDLKDQFMYGPAFLVCPVTEAGASERTVYLPKEASWINFWTGKKLAGGQSVAVHSPIDQIPLFVKSGSIVPFGPSVQYTDEKIEEPLTLRIYPGADGKFDIYEDDGTTTAYKKGEHSFIPVSWDDKSRKLTIGKRTGNFSGMVRSRQFNVVLVDGQKGAGIHFNDSGEMVSYKGRPVTLRIN